MKKFCLTLVLFVAAMASYGQKYGKVLIPHVMMENGTVVEATITGNGNAVALDINGNYTNENVVVTIEKDGVVLDEVQTSMENDTLVIYTDVAIDGTCTIIVRNTEEEVEVAETEDEETEE